MKNGTRTNLYPDKSIREKLGILSKESRQTMSAYLETLLEAQWKTRGVEVIARRAGQPEPPKSTA